MIFSLSNDNDKTRDYKVISRIRMPFQKRSNSLTWLVPFDSLSLSLEYFSKVQLYDCLICNLLFARSSIMWIRSRVGYYSVVSVYDFFGTLLRYGERSICRVCTCVVKAVANWFTWKNSYIHESKESAICGNFKIARLNVFVFICVCFVIA